MLAVNLISPVSFSAIFDSEDLKDTGIEFDSHITLLYDPGVILEKSDILPLIPDSFTELLRKKSEITDDDDLESVPDLFELGSFENDSGYVVLKLRDDSDMYKPLWNLNRDLVKSFGIKPDFSTYTPHLTLAELKPGLTEKYTTSNVLQRVLADCKVRFEDLILSYGETGKTDFDVYNLTSNCAGDRFFRIRSLKNETID